MHRHEEVQRRTMVKENSQRERERDKICESGDVQFERLVSKLPAASLKSLNDPFV